MLEGLRSRPPCPSRYAPPYPPGRDAPFEPPSEPLFEPPFDVRRDPLRICDLTTLYIDGGEGGVNTYLREKARYLSRRAGEHEHTIIVPAERSGERRLEGATLHGIASPRFFRNPQHRVLFDFAAVRRILAAARPDVIEVDCASPLARVAARATAAWRPLIVGFYHVHLPTFYARPWARSLGRVADFTLGALAEAVAWRYMRACMRPCERIVIASPALKEPLRRRGFDNVDIVPLGVNLELFQPVCGRRASADDGSAASAPRTILFVGRLSREKDLPLLFESHRLLSSRGAYRLRIAGDGPLRGLVERHARERDGVEYVGPLEYGERLARLYREADVLAVPSPSETFGLIVLEALASGIPVAAVRQGGPVALIERGLGALSRPGDAGDFADKIEEALATRHDGDRYRDHVERHFSWEQTFDRMLALYHNSFAVRAAVERTAPRRARPRPAERLA